MKLLVSVSGLFSMYSPPPWSALPGLPLSALPVTPLFRSFNGPPGGPLAIGASKSPPPRALPLAPLAPTVFPVTSLLRTVRPGSSTTMPPPAANTVPPGLEAWTWLSLMTPFVIVPKSMSAPAKAVASPAAEVTVTVLPVNRVLPIVPSRAPPPVSPSASPCDPGSVVEVTVLPANAVASPTELVIVAELPEMVVFVMLARATSSEMKIPPGCARSSTLAGKAALSTALLFVTELSLIVTTGPPSTQIPPPSAKRPLGAVALATLPEMTLFLTVNASSQLMIPAPAASLASVERPEADPTRLPLIVVWSSVSVPQLSMPPPFAHANGHGPAGQGGPNGKVVVGATRLPVMALFLILTVAPPLKSAFGGISTPPPSAITPSSPANGVDSGLERVTPPVIVMPSMDTVGSLNAPNVPIVSTGPPPRMVVNPAPAPTTSTLASIVTPPAYVPGPIRIVSPLCAAATAGASCVYGQPLGQTFSVAAEAGPGASKRSAAIPGISSTSLQAPPKREPALSGIRVFMIRCPFGRLLSARRCGGLPRGAAQRPRRRSPGRTPPRRRASRTRRSRARAPSAPPPVGVASAACGCTDRPPPPARARQRRPAPELPAEARTYAPAMCTAKVNGSSNGSIVSGENPPPVNVHSPFACASIPGLPRTMVVWLPTTRTAPVCASDWFQTTTSPIPVQVAAK